MNVVRRNAKPDAYVLLTGDLPKFSEPSAVGTAFLLENNFSNPFLFELIKHITDIGLFKIGAG